MEGLALIENLINASGLPEKSLDLELTRLLTASGCEAQSLTLEKLRDILETYLKDVLLEAKNAQT